MEKKDQVSLSLQVAWYQREHQAGLPALDGSAFPSLQLSKSYKRAHSGNLPMVRTDILSAMPLQGREVNGTSRIIRKSGSSMRRTEGRSQYDRDGV
jgi:hypothetical protein